VVTQAFKDCLAGIYRGEQVGEAIFETTLPRAADAEQRYILASLLQFETEGKTKIRPLLMKYGMSIAEDVGARPEGTAAANAISQMPWRERFDTMAKSINSVYLPKYRELEKLVTENEDADAYALATFMGEHEIAIMRACENVAAGKSNPIEPVVSLLRFPLAEAEIN
jgi:hypothetical protein